MWPERAKGGRPRKTNSSGEFVFELVQLKEIDITAKESFQAQFLVKLPDETFEAVSPGRGKKGAVPESYRKRWPVTPATR